MTSDYPPVVVVSGPTAVGKSRLALDLARSFDGDIVTADSRQIYRYMDIGTAKPTRAEQAQVRHTMIDLVEPHERYSAQRFREEGLRVLRGIAARDRIAIVAGGTGFYLRALLDGMSLPPVPPNEPLRDSLRELAATHGPLALHERLAARDPHSAGRIHPHNLPRVVRALEVVEALGGPVPASEEDSAIPALWLGLTTDRGFLHAVADARVLEQVEKGLVGETAQLLAMGYASDAPALSGFGYREMVSFIEGRCSLDDAITHYQTATRRYIRRQYTWFKADERIQWFDVRTQDREAREAVREYLNRGIAAEPCTSRC